MNVFFSPAYVGANFAFETTRKAGWVADSLAHAPIDGITLLEPAPLTPAQLAGVHDERYIQAIRSGEPLALAQAQDLQWDAGLWPMVLASNGGAVAAALDAMRNGVSGSLSSGLHHARRETGHGYCTFNGLVIAAHEALAAGAQRVLILDLDAHCGGGSASLIAREARIWQYDVSVDDYDHYLSRPQCQLSMVTRGDAYLDEIGKVLQQASEASAGFDLCLYNAGMDPFEGCPDGGMAGIRSDMLAERERLVFDWCQAQGLPVAFMLAGGYIGERLDAAGLVDLHRLTLGAAARIAAI